MSTLAGRVLALTILVAMSTSALTAVLLTRAIAAGNREQAAGALLANAEALAEQVQSAPPFVQLLATRRLEAQGYAVEGVAQGAPPTKVPFTDRDVAEASLRPTPYERAAPDGTWLVAARPAGDGRTVLLARALGEAVALSRAQRDQALLGVTLGLAGGAGAGLVLARGVTRPLRRVAAAARRLSAGERGVQVEPAGPREVVELADALSNLSRALELSEDRRRQFLLSVSHELRTPLTAVAGYAELLSDDTADERVATAGAVIVEEAGRLRRRVDDLLALARMEADDFTVEPGHADIGRLLRAAAQAWRPRAAARGIALDVRAPHIGPYAWTDAERLRQAVDALSDNALRVLPDGSSLVFACRADHGSVRVEVRDSGPGLSAEDHGVAFDRGRLAQRYRGSRPVGSGLGLALVGELARRLGGRAEASTSPEGGAAFSLILPTALPVPVSSLAAATDPP